MKNPVTHIARELVVKPEAVSVAEVEGNRTSALDGIGIDKSRRIGL